MRVPDYQLGEWCFECDAPQWVTPDGEHRCKDVWLDYLDAVQSTQPHPLRESGLFTDAR